MIPKTSNPDQCGRTAMMLHASRICRILFVLLALPLHACSPAYVVRAGWEETKILWRRKPLSELISSPKTDPELKRKFQLVLDAREFAAAVGLKPKGSYTQYSKVERDVLVWVLSAAPKFSLKPYTWWFPVVGRIPYKGYFEKDDGDAAAQKLREAGLDIYLRPSPAFSTLGWFDDPLLSSIVRFDDALLVDTVIHELVHNTIWIKGRAPFNESLANFAGTAGAVEFFRASAGAQDPRTVSAQETFHDELVFAHFVDQTIKAMQLFYDELPEDERKANTPNPALLAKRDTMLSEHAARWQSLAPSLKSSRYKTRSLRLNNAVLIAQRVYLDRLWLFAEMYELCGNTLERFLKQMLLIEQDVKNKQSDPFNVLQEQIDRLKKERTQ